jgi:hypothetical protein
VSNVAISSYRVLYHGTNGGEHFADVEAMTPESAVMAFMRQHPGIATAWCIGPTPVSRFTREERNALVMLIDDRRLGEHHHIDLQTLWAARNRLVAGVQP